MKRMIGEKIRKLVQDALKTLGLSPISFVVEHPDIMAHGDYSTNVAMVLAQLEKGNPRQIAADIVSELQKNSVPEIEKIEFIPPGFTNFHLSKSFFQHGIQEIINEADSYGKNACLAGEKTIIEFTDANPFKEFHIGHMMSNSIGEAIARVIEWNGAEVKRACYQGDVGMHVAKVIWAAKKEGWKTINNMKDSAHAYADGDRAYREDPYAKEEIEEINRKVYDHSNPAVNVLYDSGKKISLEVFDKMYKRLGSRFDYFFFESQTATLGKELVLKHIGDVFEKSDGAIVFHAEKYDAHLHTRVFINSEGLPVYEAKELGLAKLKYEKYHYDKSIVVTGNEIADYFKVLLCAMKLVLPDLAQKTKHLSHGMLRLSTGKMSSRTGEVISAENLIEKVKETIQTKGNVATDDIAVAAIKYSILKQSVGNDIIFDMEKSVSIEGDSGPYLQYAYARANSVLKKAGRVGDAKAMSGTTRTIERLLYRFPEIVLEAAQDFSPNQVANFLAELATSFNNFYAHEEIIGDHVESAYRLAITDAFRQVMKNGLYIIGIAAPEKM